MASSRVRCADSTLVPFVGSAVGGWKRPMAMYMLSLRGRDASGCDVEVVVSLSVMIDAASAVLGFGDCI